MQEVIFSRQGMFADNTVLSSQNLRPPTLSYRDVIYGQFLRINYVLKQIMLFEKLND